MPEIISLNQISKTYERKIALSSLSFSVNKGESIALIGPSGAGKTTLLNIMASILTPDEGEIFIDGSPLSDFKDQRKRAKKIGVIRQQFDLVGELPVIHNVLAGRLSDWGVFKSLLSFLIPQDKQYAVKALERVGLMDKLYDRTSILSGGEQQRVALARLLVQNPEIILADEPVASLDPARAEDILDLLANIAVEEKQTLMASLHSVEYAKKYFDRIIALKNGEIFFDLPAASVTDAHIASLYKLKEQA
ncbi:phosphonate ABC transporter ATP-binding protein [Mesobacillus subterraneus]|jgi:phosphonate transport system ATP-binding protein|uniref:phosphonate ABC transporter ATP-binding protein n=1 Tax=Mesobacillus subterraneus TaxID=285983 RepID=UPI0020408CD1|nr:phosphonate ABC transporter ATP-binding protein [Mesobacillus subterraneus]MCM3664100.1 phosphonate ABC transporter ATP-binding protein [Mesobacillus subterraneus]MCM3682128.1 phosphonate ABC transporter ATP-binding protein [Mesobacillus subterraneus]